MVRFGSEFKKTTSCVIIYVPPDQFLCCVEDQESVTCPATA
jgi:hypothetical protein